MSLARVKLYLLAGLTVSLVLAGCTTQKRAPAPGEHSETLLRSEDSQVAGEDDPVAAHLAARQQVDPRDTRSSHAYTTKPTAEEIERDTTRVVQVEKKPGGIQNIFKQFKPKPSEPAVRELKTASKITPPRKPGKNTVPTVTDGAVTGVRSGEHPGKVRVVLDLTEPVKFNAAIDNAEKILVIELPGTAWQTSPQGPFRANPMVAGYSAGASANGGVTLTVKLKQAARLVLSAPFPPNEVYGHRIVFDVAPL